jgi:hypothetical protein
VKVGKLKTKCKKYCIWKWTFDADHQRTSRKYVRNEIIREKGI